MLPENQNRTSAEQAEFDSGAQLARDGKTLPDSSSGATQQGYASVKHSPNPASAGTASQLPSIRTTPVDANNPPLPPEIKGTSTVSSLLRIARDLRSAGVWGWPALSKAADIFETEAGVLDPSSKDQITRQKLQEKTDAAKVAVGKAQGVLDDPQATPAQHADAAKALGAAGR
jgi:hypothetical protein